jgi:hypothetical protein
MWENWDKLNTKAQQESQPFDFITNVFYVQGGVISKVEQSENEKIERN